MTGNMTGLFFTFMWPCIVTNFFIIKPTRCTNFQNLLWHETVHVLGSSSAHHQEFIHCALGTGICHTGLRTSFEQEQDGTGFILLLVGIPVWHIQVLSVQWINYWRRAEELPKTCRVSRRRKFGKLVHLVGFITKKDVWTHYHNYKICTVSYPTFSSIHFCLLASLCQLVYSWDPAQTICVSIFFLSYNPTYLFLCTWVRLASVPVVARSKSCVLCHYFMDYKS